MSPLAPIEPFLLAAQSRHLDYRTDGDRRHEIFSTHRAGLSQLVGNQEFPTRAFTAVRDGVWAPVGRAGIFLVKEESRNRSATERVRYSVFAGLDPESSNFRPVVVADRPSVDATVDHLRQSGVDPCGVVAFYRDEEHQLEKAIEIRDTLEPLVRIQPTPEQAVSVWRLTDEEAAEMAELIGRRGGAILGDINLYRALLRVRDDPIVSAHSRPVVQFYNQRDFGVTLASQVRMYNFAGSFDPNSVLKELHALYEVEEMSTGGGLTAETIVAFGERLRMEAVSARVFGLLLRNVETLFLVKAREEQVNLIGHENPPEIAGSFDVEWVEKGVLRRLYPEEDFIPGRVVPTAGSVLEIFGQESADIAVMLNPPSKRRVFELSKEGWKLPIESLQLTPPVPRGLFLSPLRPSKQLLKSNPLNSPL